ncbi:MAG: N-acetyltransferase [Pseudomonadota bacterium]
MEIREVTAADHSAIAKIIIPVFRAGETYTIEPDISEADAIAYWTAPDKTVFVASIDGEVLGTYYIKANQAGGGSHVCNCGYMTSEAARGRGIASSMCEHSLSFARLQGFIAMQFNFVVSNNVGAIRLWKKYGFEVVGNLPEAFNHPKEGYLDALVMHRAL